MTPELHDVLHACWDRGGFTTRSDFARAEVDHIAAAAFLGLISTLSPEGEWTRTWRMTAKGLRELFKGLNDAQFLT